MQGPLCHSSTFPLQGFNLTHSPPGPPPPRRSAPRGAREREPTTDLSPVSALFAEVPDDWDCTGHGPQTTTNSPTRPTVGDRTPEPPMPFPGGPHPPPTTTPTPPPVHLESPLLCKGPKTSVPPLWVHQKTGKKDPPPSSKARIDESWWTYVDTRPVFDPQSSPGPLVGQGAGRPPQTTEVVPVLRWTSDHEV